MMMKPIIVDDELIGSEAHIRVAESTFNQCVKYMEIADLEGYVGGTYREDGSIEYELQACDEELSEGINEDIPHRLLKMIEKAIKAGADHLVIELEKSGDMFAA